MAAIACSAVDTGRPCSGAPPWLVALLYSKALPEMEVLQLRRKSAPASSALLRAKRTPSLRTHAQHAQAQASICG